MKKYIYLLLLFFVFVSCDKDEEKNIKNSGFIEIEYSYSKDNEENKSYERFPLIQCISMSVPEEERVLNTNELQSLYSENIIILSSKANLDENNSIKGDTYVRIHLVTSKEKKYNGKYVYASKDEFLGSPTEFSNVFITMKGNVDYDENSLKFKYSFKQDTQSELQLLDYGNNLFQISSFGHSEHKYNFMYLGSIDDK